MESTVLFNMWPTVMLNYSGEKLLKWCFRILKTESWNIFTESEISRSKSNLSRCLEANLQTPDENYGCLCNLLLWGRLANEIQFVEVSYGTFVEIQRSECIWVTPRAWPRNEWDQSWLSWTQYYRALGNPLGFLSIYHLPWRPSRHLYHLPTTPYFISNPRFKFQPFLKLFCGVIMDKCGTGARELPFNIRIYLKQNSKSLMSFILVRNTV